VVDAAPRPACHFGLLCGQYGLVYWLPQIVKGVVADIGLDKVLGVSINALTGYLVAVPFAFAGKRAMAKLKQVRALKSSGVEP
jgi:hypothetical protein